MELMNQPFSGQLGNRLIELLESADYHTLNFAVAFAKNSGVLRIKDSLEKFRARGGTVNAFVGVDLGGTSYEALTALLLHTNSLNVVHAENGQTFHTKTYQFIGKDKSLMVVGSHNLTGGGLWTNFESSVLIPADGSSADSTRMLKEASDYIARLVSLKGSFMSIKAQEDVDKLLHHGYVSKEVTEQIRRAKVAAQNGVQPRLFGNGAPAALPRVRAPGPAVAGQAVAAPAAPAAPAVISLSGEDQTIWFETRRMTGGSRNILDLSMKSLIERGDPSGTTFDLGDPKFMRGGVEFFGLNPTVTHRTKNITLNFDGIDYSDNTILFPDGKNANGTWRLQIKGVDSSGTKITDAFRAKGKDNYLVQKIITFTKIKDDYYFLSVFPDFELANFETASRILARNGSTRTAKRLGII